MNTTTGRGPGGGDAGVQTFRVRQSSLVPAGSGVKNAVVCGHDGPKAVASRTPSHGATGCGGRHRSGPTGGAANGMLRKTATSPSTSPRSRPAVVAIVRCALPVPMSSAPPSVGAAR